MADQHPTRRPTRLILALTAIVLLAAGGTRSTAQLLAPPPLPSTGDLVLKLDPLARARAGLVTGRSRLVVRAPDLDALAALAPLIEQLGGTIRRTLPIVTAQAVDLPNSALLTLAGSALVERISLDRLTAGALDRTGATVGATAVREGLGLDGSGIGVAVIDSGITAWHDDLAAQDGGQRVAHFADFVNGRDLPYDDYGHGTHVAGIVAGNGFDSGGARTGIAPGVRLIVLKVLDGTGRGHISDVIAALDHILANNAALGVRVVNLSVATGVYESYDTDPLTLAARRVVDAGIVVVAAAGNHGRHANGGDAYGGITAPGNAPWVLTVGAASHGGTSTRRDDTMAVFSSRGPTAVDHAAKPDLVAPGVGIESLSDPDSAFYTSRSAYLLSGTMPTAYLPYLSLSGTSMAAPVVSGTVALMLQAGPALTPNAVKAILQFTAEVYSEYDPLTQGAGFLNAAGAVELARTFARGDDRYPSVSSWSRHVIWGNQLIRNGRLTPHTEAVAAHVTWGAAADADGDPITWEGWSHDRRNVVWGSSCGGEDCAGSWDVGDASVVWGTRNADSVVWGTSDDEDTVAWGTSCTDSSCEPVVWDAP